MLDELVGVIETLKARIGAHREALQANETRTRVALIDPLLCALGWDTSDPALVTVECEVRNRKADYGLLDTQAEPLVFLEAKHLEEPLSKHLYQVANYANHVGIRYYALTNGDDWEVYDNDKNHLPIEERDILKLSLSREPTHQSALKLLLMWRANVTSGTLQPALRPIVESTSMPSPEPDPIPPTRSKARPGKGWTRLSELYDVTGTPNPSLVEFPSGEERTVENWRGLLIEVAEWLVREGSLDSKKCPVKASRKGSYFVHTKAHHQNPKRTFASPRRLSNGLFLAAHGSAAAMVDRSRRLLERLGQDPAQVWLKTG